jgi:hypothetical protein
MSQSDGSNGGTMALNKDEILTFHETGFLGPYQLYTPEEMADIRKKVNEEKEASDGPRGNEHMYRHLDCPTVYSLCSSKEIIERVQSIIGPDLMLWASTLFEKMPGMDDFAWHQDTQYFDLEPPVNITAWIALTESNIDNGCMQIIPGSHRKHIPHVEDSSRPIFDLKADPQEFDSEKAIDIELEPGEFILFNERLLHRSRANKTDKARFGLSARITLPYSRVSTSDPKIIISGEDWNNINNLTSPPEF